MEVLTLLIAKAAETGELSAIAGCSLKQRISIYADDVALFIKPRVQDLVAVRGIFDMSSQASGLQVNYNKSEAVVIHGELEDKMTVRNLLHCTLGDFPCKYLGL
ncbi:hypothetical protein ACQ4PT_019659 [Festuca glaucescens]